MLGQKVESLPSRERGLKSCDPADGVFVGAVAPFTERGLK